MKSDIYSIGYVLWFLWKVSSPHEGDLTLDESKIKLKMAFDKKELPIPIDPSIPWHKVIMKCWNFEILKRPNVQEVIADLDSVQLEINNSKDPVADNNATKETITDNNAKKELISNQEVEMYAESWKNLERLMPPVKYSTIELQKRMNVFDSVYHGTYTIKTGIFSQKKVEVAVNRRTTGSEREDYLIRLEIAEHK